MKSVEVQVRIPTGIEDVAPNAFHRRLTFERAAAKTFLVRAAGERSTEDRDQDDEGFTHGFMTDQPTPFVAVFTRQRNMSAHR